MTTCVVQSHAFARPICKLLHYCSPILCLVRLASASRLIAVVVAHTSCDCYAEGKPLPTELRREEAKLRHDVELEDDNTAVPRTHIDDEYAHADERDPTILITTSRDPSTRLVAFAKELKLVFPNAQRINRGGMASIPQSK